MQLALFSNMDFTSFYVCLQEAKYAAPQLHETGAGIMGGNAWRGNLPPSLEKWLNTGDRPTGRKGRCHLTPLPWVNINGGNENSERRYIHERLDDF